MDLIHSYVRSKVGYSGGIDTTLIDFIEDQQTVTLTAGTASTISLSQIIGATGFLFFGIHSSVSTPANRRTWVPLHSRDSTAYFDVQDRQGISIWGDRQLDSEYLMQLMREIFPNSYPFIQNHPFYCIPYNTNGQAYFANADKENGMIIHTGNEKLIIKPSADFTTGSYVLDIFVPILRSCSFDKDFEFIDTAHLVDTELYAQQDSSWVL
jgi:hypothetical protein